MKFPKSFIITLQTADYSKMTFKEVVQKYYNEYIPLNILENSFDEVYKSIQYYNNVYFFLKALV